MPELPEVETTRRGIEPYLVGQTIVKSDVRVDKLRWPIPHGVKQLHNEPIYSVQRRAKYLLIELGIGWLVIHLGMSGSLRILMKPQPAAKHDHIDLILSTGVILRYTDPRKFGCWLWFPALHDCRLLQKLAPEPLSDEFNADYLYQKSQGRKAVVKTWLMESKTVVGVGNIYANESLFKAKISPFRVASSLNYEEVVRLVKAIKQILQHAIEQGGTTLRDFVNSEGKPGYFAQSLHVYHRAGQTCLNCGNEIKIAKIGQRSTFYCDNCQQ